MDTFDKGMLGIFLTGCVSITAACYLAILPPGCAMSSPTIAESIDREHKQQMIRTRRILLDKCDSAEDRGPIKPYCDYLIDETVWGY